MTGVRTWTDERGLPLVWGLSAPDLDGYRSTRLESQADVRVVALEPVLDLLEKVANGTKLFKRRPEVACSCQTCSSLAALEALLQAYNRLPKPQP